MNKNPLGYKVSLVKDLTHFALSHEYALINFSEADLSDREEFLVEMEDCRKMYLQTRKKLELIDPAELMKLESDLLLQKQTFSASQLTLQ